MSKKTYTGKPMILKGLVESLRRRDWFTVFMEIMIVVVGVFIGIEVSNWNQDRQNRALAESYLVRLTADLESQIATWEDALQYFRQTRQHTLSALENFQSPVEDLGEQFLIDLYQASQARNLSVRRSTYDELVATGGIEYLPPALSREALGVYYDLSERWLAVAGDITDYRPVIRRHMDYRVQEAIVDACGDVYVRHRFGYSAVQLPDDCDIVLPAALVSAEVEQLHANAIVEQHLRYQASNLRSRTQAIENALVATRNTLAAVRQIKGSES